MHRLVFVALFACSHTAAPLPAARATAPNASGPSTTLAPADLGFEPRAEPGTSLFTMSRDGELRSGTNLIGTLEHDGVLTFAADGRVTARLVDGVVVITGPSSPASGLPGDLSKLLHDYEGTIRSAFTIHDDGTAMLANQPVTIDADGVLDKRLRVTGLTPATRRMAMFIYALMSTITP
jgi:hypothetical protein